ncbi:MAG: phosphoribosylanthranilate isomerase [Agathobacter sp.]|nr:phosphoribosylanthranilate isomerase [Agathobacter sp.]MEE1102114.1 phosphoribosylanthranilate isomerase [Agathobacter sp.]
MEVKICGIRKQAEITYLNEYKPEYAGFVIWEKSKRYVSVEDADKLMKLLDNDIKRVAVTVAPTLELIEQINETEFDIIQIHKNLSEDMIEKSQKPIWYAINISEVEEIKSNLQFIKNLPCELYTKIRAIVVDGAKYGSGQTFKWDDYSFDELKEMLTDKKIILAGGLNCDNVKNGINKFKPDVVDVSSGVEGTNGKDRELIKLFIERAKENE